MTDTSPKFSGEPNAQVLANGLATLGRYGDNYMVHAAEGETVVPKEVLDANPGLKEDLFKQMITMGIKDPDRYVVGNQLNSINPITGQPEFFFKKIFKAVKKVAKKVLPVAAPIIGNLIAPGIGGIIASGLTTSLTGGSASDALKSMALSYGIGALGRGLQSGFTATSGNFLDNFGTGLQRGLTAPGRAIAGLIEGGQANPFQQGIFGSRSLSDVGFFPEYQSGPFTQGAGIDPENLSRLQGVQSRSFAPITPSGAIGRSQIPRVFDPQLSDDAFRRGTQRSFMPITPGEEGPGLKGIYSTTKAVPPSSSIEKAVTSSVQDAAKEATEKGLLERFGSFITGDKLTGTPASLAGAGALGIGAYLAADALTPHELSVAEQLERLPDSPERRAYEQWKGIQDKSSPAAQSLKSVWYGTPSYSASQLKSMFGSNPLSNITEVAGGGEIVGPGTGTSDSIPAMLSDGEFVMTAKAVRNAGNGDRDLGAARMYDMMNRFEKGTA